MYHLTGDVAHLMWHVPHAGSSMALLTRTTAVSTCGPVVAIGQESLPPASTLACTACWNLAHSGWPGTPAIWALLIKSFTCEKSITPQTAAGWQWQGCNPVSHVFNVM